MKKMKCPKCKYEWETKSKLMFVCCPNCQRKVPKTELSPISKKEINEEKTQQTKQQVRKV